MSDSSSSNAHKTFIRISVYKSARVSDLIGLICYKYTCKKKMPPLRLLKSLCKFTR